MSDRRLPVRSVVPVLRGAALALALALVLPLAALAQEEGYRLPPADVVQILDAPDPPYVRVSPDRESLVLAHRRSMPTIEAMAEPMLRLAGRRINPLTNGSFSPSLITGFSVMRVRDGTELPVDVPHEDGWGFPSFSPDGESFYVTRDTDEGIELWMGSVSGASMWKLGVPPLNGARGSECTWMPDSEHLLCHFVPEGRGAPPAEPRVPSGPVIQEASGRDAPVRTYQDLLEGPHDEALYDYYMTSQPALVEVTTSRVSEVSEPAVYASVSPSPSGEYLLVERRVKPYSYLVTDRRFPLEIEIRDRSGQVVERLHELPIQEEIPIGGVSDDPRSHQWLDGEPHTLLWVEALDDGDTRSPAEERDRVRVLEAPFDGEPEDLVTTELRYSGLVRAEESSLAFMNTFHRPSRTVRTFKVDLAARPLAPELVWERNYEDRYGDPGSPVTRPDGSGDNVMIRDGDWIYLTGSGASEEGDRPFLDRMNVRTGDVERLWRSGPDSYEVVVALLDDGAERIVTRYETVDEPPNYFVRNLSSGERTALTDFPNPHPQLAGVEKRFVTYERDDGVQLSGDVYLPPDYREGERYPAVIWAYPREYSSADIASQVRGSPNRFTRVGGSSHMFFLTQGYVVFDGPAMPIVGGDTANNTYVQQLVASARAAVDQLDEMGVADPDRVGIGGHSYGAFMTANLLAHSDIFRAGIARSGAYNRSLTPFGFQSEQRTFWEAPEIYFAMSPFMHAADLDEPMLMIHGINDNNSGTFPVQSERMYHAVKGLGGTVRLVMLPYESHGYRARESVLHTLHEMLSWFDEYVKNAPPRGVAEEGASGGGR